MSFLWRLATGSSSNNNTTNINNVCQDEPDDAAIVIVNNNNNFLCQHEPDDAAVVFNHKKNKTVQQSTTKTTTTTATESSSHIEQKEETTPLNESNGTSSNRVVVAVAAATTNIPKEENTLVYNNNNNINTTRQTSAAITTTTASSTTIHWKEAHYETCLRKGSLAVSIHQVLKLYHSVSYVPQQLQQSTSTSSSTSQDEVFLWKEEEEQSEKKKGSDKENETLQQSLQKLLMEEQYQSTDDESSNSSSNNNKSLLARFSRLFYTAITGTSSSLSSNDDDLANMHASQAAAAEVDDAVLYQESLRNASGTSTRIIKDSDLIVNTDLTRRVLKLLAKIITQQQQQHSTDPLVVPMPSFADWFLHSINSNRNNHATTSLSQDEEEPALLDLITRLPQHQVQVLLQTLASNTTNKQQQQQSSLRVVSDRNPPLFVLGVTTDRTCQVATALYDLEHAQDNLERNIHQAHETAAQYAAKALQYKRNATTTTRTATTTTTSNNTSQQAALHCLQLRKLYLNRAAHDENVLLNLKQTQLTLETASQQQSIVNVLASARDALKMLRTSTTTDTEQILEDYALEMEWSQQMQQSLLEATAAVGNDIVDVDDDELPQQLEELTLEEEEEQQQQQQKQEVLPLPAAEGTGGNSSSRSPTDDLVLPVTEEAKEPRLDSLASVAQESSATQQPPVALT